MKTYVKKQQALSIVPTLLWEKVGTLMKKPKKVKADVVLDAIKTFDWRMYFVGGRHVVCSTEDHDKYYEGTRPDIALE